MKRYLKDHDNKQRSKPHQRVESILDEMMVNYLSEYPMPPYCLDIFLPEWRIGLEIDGPMHSKHKDKLRDEVIMNKYGVPILRISALKWFTKEKIKKEVTLFIETWEPSAQNRSLLAKEPNAR